MNPDEITKILSLDEKIRFFNGVGSWKTYTADGKLPVFFMSDGPHGLRKQDAENYRDLNKSNIATCFPTASCIASSWNTNSAMELGSAIATEALAENVNLMLGPGMNIKRSPLCGRNFEYFSEDPYLTGKMAAAYVNGMQSKGVGSCVKHFACNQQEKRRQTSSSNVDENTLNKIYLSAFEYVIKNANPAAVMCSYNKLNGTYTCHNRHLLTEILREQWNYEGVVISDWGACIDAAKCLKAGMDLAMPDSFGYFDTQLKIALNSGKISEQDLDNANTRLAKMINKYSAGSKQNTIVDYDEQHKVALKLAEDSAVLLKNDGFLPIKPETTKKILVLGELAKQMKFQGGGSSHISTKEYPNALQTLTAAGFEVDYEPGYFAGFCKRSKAQRKNAPLMKKAVEAARLACVNDIPILLFCGLTDAFEGEGFDRTDLRLPCEQLHLINEVLNITSNVAVISFSGAPINLSPAKKARSILHMYLSGEACGQAVTDLVTGVVNPSGHLAETWPLRIEDTPSHNNFAPDSDDVNYAEGALVGYRWYNEKKIPVLFPFGFGLSYTTFEYDVKTENAEFVKNSGLKKINLLKKLDKVQVMVTNTGSVDGSEVVQCYFNGELCGFAKEFIKAGEQKLITVNCEITQAMLLPASENIIKQNFFEKQKAALEEDISHFNFVISHSLGDMAQECFRIRFLLKVIERVLAIMNKKSREDPAVKIEIAAIYENPLESLISTSGGIITEKFARRLLKWANRKYKTK